MGYGGSEKKEAGQSDFAKGTAYLPPSVFFCKSEKVMLSSHTISPRFQSGFNSKIMCPPQGFVYAFGSSIVTSIVNVSWLARRTRSTTCSSSVCGWPSLSSQVLSLNPTESTTSVSPSHLPIESPIHVEFKSLGC